MVQALVYSFILFLSLVGLGTGSHVLQRGHCGCSASFSGTKPVVSKQTRSLSVPLLSQTLYSHAFAQAISST